mmetsp:Transcript_32376/g.92350  ORF Transcript_32376/g.92350 Transcript_32376/m.92350 type:complete len:526 (+) Transcript_32376:64-1641(+)
MAHAERSKWEAFKMVKDDNVEGLRRVLSDHHYDEWSRWQNYSGKTLLELAEHLRVRMTELSDMGGFSDTAMYLRERMMREGIESGTIRRTSPTIRELTVDDPTPGRFSPRRVIDPGVGRYPVMTHVAREPAMTQSVITEPVSIYQEPVRTEHVITEPVAYREPVVAREPSIPRDPQVVSPNLVETSVEVVDIQDHPIVVEVPQHQVHTVTREVPRVNVIEATETHEVCVDHREECLDVSLYPEITKVNVPKVTVHQKVEFRQTHTEVQERDVVIEETLAPPTVDMPKLVLRPEPAVTPMYISGPTEIFFHEEVIEYNVDYTVPRREVLLKPVVEKVAKTVQIPRPEEHIVEVPEEHVETREVVVPQVTTVKKIHYIPTYPSQTMAERIAEPIAEPIAGRRTSPVVHRRLDRQYVDLDGTAGEDMQREVERLRSENRQQEQEGLQLQEELRRCQSEVDRLNSELGKEKRLRHELGVQLRADPQGHARPQSPPRGRTPPRSTAARAAWYGEDPGALPPGAPWVLPTR